MNRILALGCVIVSAFVISGCGGEGGGDTDTASDAVVSVDYGQNDVNHPTDVVVLDDEGNPIDINVPHDANTPHDDNTATDTKPPKDSNTGEDTNGTDTTVSEFCDMPVGCAKETIEGIRDNCDGTFTDTTSGLMWQGQGDDHPLAATGSNLMSRQCNTASTGCNNGRHYADWRVPTIDEVRTLVRGCAAIEEGGACPASDECTAFDTCLTSSCNGCGNDNGAFEYVDGSDTYHRYTDPRFTSSGYGTSYSTVMSGTNVNKAVSDSRYRFYYILNYNGKLSALNPMQEATEGVLFCVRDAN
jgi:hypothetical protein